MWSSLVRSFLNQSIFSYLHSVQRCPLCSGLFALQCSVNGTPNDTGRWAAGGACCEGENMSWVVAGSNPGCARMSVTNQGSGWPHFVVNFDCPLVGCGFRPKTGLGLLKAETPGQAYLEDCRQCPINESRTFCFRQNHNAKLNDQIIPRSREIILKTIHHFMRNLRPSCEFQ